MAAPLLEVQSRLSSSGQLEANRLCKSVFSSDPCLKKDFWQIWLPRCILRSLLEVLSLRLRLGSEFGLQNGTTYNSFLVRGDKVALIDASHEKFRDLYLATLRDEIDPSTIDYIVANHTEPDHSGLIPDLLKLAPNATVVGSKVCIQFLQNLVLKPFKSKAVAVCTVCMTQMCVHMAHAFLYG